MKEETRIIKERFAKANTISEVILASKKLGAEGYSKVSINKYATMRRKELAEGIKLDFKKLERVMLQPINLDARVSSLNFRVEDNKTTNASIKICQDGCIVL